MGRFDALVLIGAFEVLVIWGGQNLSFASTTESQDADFGHFLLKVDLQLNRDSFSNTVDPREQDQEEMKLDAIYASINQILLASQTTEYSTKDCTPQNHLAPLQAKNSFSLCASLVCKSFARYYRL